MNYEKEFLGPSAAVEKLKEQIERQSNLSMPLLIEGEKGAGKRTAARAVHRSSSLASKPCLDVDLTDDTPEARLPEIQELQARGGFVLFEEIGSATRAQQDRLWRWLRSLDRVAPSHGGIRLVSTCEGSLGKLVARHRFRADLYLRLAVTSMEVPPLRERREDIPHLVREFLEEFAEQSGEPGKMLTAAAMDWVLAFSWPGNVAQLRQEIFRAAGSTAARVLGAEEFSQTTLPGPEKGDELCVRESFSLQERVEQFERSEVLRTLQDAGGVRDRAARILGIDRRTLQRKLRRWRQSTVIPPRAS